MRFQLVVLAAVVACATPKTGATPAKPVTQETVVTRGEYGPEPSVEPTAIEQAATTAVRERLARGKWAPSASPSLIVTARVLAQRAADGDKSPIELAKLRSALSSGLAYDPAPAAHLVAGPSARLVSSLLSTLSPSAATHIGVGTASSGRTVFLVLLTSERKALLRKFPRNVEKGSRQTLQGELLNLNNPRVFVTTPSGKVERPSTRGDRSFSADLRFEQTGVYLVEVVGTGPTGPEVAALLSVSCGGASLEPPAGLSDSAQSAAVEDTEAGIVEAINAARNRQGLAPLSRSRALDSVAQRHSIEMLARGQLAHVLPGSGDVGARLRRARVPFRMALENVAKASTAIGAHRAAEESPAHRGNILSPNVTEIGCGIARGRLPSGDAVVYVTEIFTARVDDSSDSRLRPETRVKEALWHERERLGRPALLSDAGLDSLAREAVSEMVRRGEPGRVDVAERVLTMGRKLSAVDTFVAASIEDTVRSPNVGDTRFRRVGVSVTQNDHPTYGAGLLWIAVLYTD